MEGVGVLFEVQERNNQMNLFIRLYNISYGCMTVIIRISKPMFMTKIYFEIYMIQR